VRARRAILQVTPPKPAPQVPCRAITPCICRSSTCGRGPNPWASPPSPGWSSRRARRP